MRLRVTCDDCNVTIHWTVGAITRCPCRNIEITPDGDVCHQRGGYDMTLTWGSEK